MNGRRKETARVAKTLGAVGFFFMSAMFRVRDRLRPPARVLEESGLRPGMRVLDFGCGPGAYSVAAARIVGSTGSVVALDASPIAIEAVRRRASREGVGNVEAVLAEDAASLPDLSFDFAILYDILHMLSRTGKKYWARSRIVPIYEQERGAVRHGGSEPCASAPSRLS